MSNCNIQIPWEQFAETHNRMYKTDFRTPQEMLTALYAREKTVEKVGEIIGVSGNTINRFMKRWGLPRSPRGHRGKSKLQIAYRKIRHPEQYKSREIAGMLECSTGYVFYLRRNAVK